MTVALFTLGGTISMAGAEIGTGVVARLAGDDLTRAIPGLEALDGAIRVHDAAAVPSASLTAGQVLDVVDAARRAVADGALGVVLTQGTDTLEETAWLVDLVWPCPEPFVLTGAMRNPTVAGADGAANLLGALRVALSQDARELGALVVFNDEIHAARWVRKRHSTNTGAFVSPNAGPVGDIVEDRVRINARPVRRPVVAAPDRSRLAGTHVALYTATFDDDGLLLDGVADTHAGLVIAGLGAGHVRESMAPQLGRIAERMPVVLTSRTGAGEVLRQTYGAIGGEIDLQRRGLITAGILDPFKARVLLRLLIAGGADREAIAAEFAARG
jgi:L-asparaginase